MSVLSEKGVVFSVEAAAAAVILLAIMLVVLSSIHLVKSPDNELYSSLTVAHDLIYAHSTNPPEGYVNDEGWCKSNKNYVAKLSISDYDNWHAEVCMK